MINKMKKIIVFSLVAVLLSACSSDSDSVSQDFLYNTSYNEYKKYYKTCFIESTLNGEYFEFKGYDISKMSTSLSADMSNEDAYHNVNWQYVQPLKIGKQAIFQLQLTTFKTGDIYIDKSIFYNDKTNYKKSLYAMNKCAIIIFENTTPNVVKRVYVPASSQPVLMKIISCREFVSTDNARRYLIEGTINGTLYHYDKTGVVDDSIQVAAKFRFL